MASFEPISTPNVKRIVLEKEEDKFHIFLLHTLETTYTRATRCELAFWHGL